MQSASGNQSGLGVLVQQINQGFQKIDDLVEAYLSGRVEVASEIDLIFKDLKSIIDADEFQENEQFHGYFKYVLHSRQATYLGLLGNHVGAAAQEKLAKRFELFKQYADRYIVTRDLGLPSTVVDLDFSADFEDFDAFDVQASIDRIVSLLDDLKVIVPNNLVQDFQVLLARTASKSLHDLNHYLELITVRDELSKVLDECLLKLSEKQCSTSNVGISEKLKDKINELHVIIKRHVYPLQVQFMQELLADISNQVPKLFGDTSVLTEENLKKRYRELCRLFHPDKAQWIRDKHKPTLLNFFNLIKEGYEALQEGLEQQYATSSKYNFYEQEALQYWSRSQDYRHALNQDWLKIQFEDVGLLRTFTQEHLKSKRVEYAELSYQRYRVCCKIADENKHFQKQVKLRSTMALCKYVMGSEHYLEAQLYAISAVRLIMDHSQHMTHADLLEAKKILDKVRGIQTIASTNTVTASSTDPLSQALVLVDQNRALSLMAPVAQNYSFGDRQRMAGSIDQELKTIANQLMVRADGAMVRYMTSQEDILKAKRQGTAHKTVGTGVMVGGVIGGGTVVVSAGVEVLQAAGVVAGSALGGPIVAVVGGLFAIGLGVYAGYQFIKRGNEILKEPEVRQNLNEMMVQALSFYKDRKFQDFIGVLSREYQPGLRLFQLNGPSHVIDANKVIEVLLKHGFRPDGIAYLLNLLGEVLNSQRLSIPGLTERDCVDRAKQIFHSVLSAELEASAKSLDDRISRLRSSDLESRLRNQSSFLKDFFFLRDTGSIASEHVGDSEEMTFRARLEEMRNTARINIAIMRAISGVPDELEMAKKMVKDVRQSIETHYQFFSTARNRLTVLEDFLWVVSGQSQEVPIMLLQSGSAELPTAEVPVDETAMLEYLTARMRIATSVDERVNLYCKKGLCYERIAKAHARSNHIQSLAEWQEAQRNYGEALRLTALDLSAGLGYARCLLSLSHYGQTITFLQKNRHLSKASEYWVLAAIAHRRRVIYPQANSCVQEALKLDARDLKASQERGLLKRLEHNPVKKRPDIYEEPLKVDQEHFELGRSREQRLYKILSIDGGGVRGVIPAFWLSEIERSMRRPVVHLFDMMSGTSTGAIIAAGLSSPYLRDRDIRKDENGQTVLDVPIFSNYMPQYRAFDILELYRHQNSEIFSRDPQGLFSLPWLKEATAPKYTDRGRLKLFSKYFEDRKLSDSLVDLVIPAVEESNVARTYLFSAKDAKRDSSRFDQLLTDALMATTAAPTAFPAYRIRGRGVFVDGGIHVNNPAQVAYHEAIASDIASEQVFVLSLGTGSCMPDPLNPDACRGLLFWAQNLHKAALPAQEGNVDRQMYQTLGERYQRWQTWMDSPIALDDCQPETIDQLLEMSRQHIEELYASDDNQLGKLFELLDSDMDSFSSREHTNSTTRSTFTPSYDHGVQERSVNVAEKTSTQSIALRRFEQF